MLHIASLEKRFTKAPKEDNKIGIIKILQYRSSKKLVRYKPARAMALWHQGEKKISCL